MKKHLLFFFLFLANLNTYAQKSYILIDGPNSNVRLSGNIPSDMESFYHVPNYNNFYQQLLVVINMLAERGYELEIVADGKYFMSKKTTESANAIQKVRANDRDSVTEIARYNLQSMPVRANEKGIQIIVYSNYTTKTIIVE